MLTPLQQVVQCAKELHVKTEQAHVKVCVLQELNRITLRHEWQNFCWEVYVAESGCQPQGAAQGVEKREGPKDTVLQYDKYLCNCSTAKIYCRLILGFVIFNACSISQCSSSDMYKQRIPKKRKQGEIKNADASYHTALLVILVCMHTPMNVQCCYIYIYDVLAMCLFRVQQKVVSMPKTFHTAHCFLWLSAKSMTFPTLMVCWLRCIHLVWLP